MAVAADAVPAAPVTQAARPPFVYPQFVERLKQPSAQAVVQEVRDFVGDFPPGLSRPQGARRIHAFVTAAAERLLLAEVFAGSSAEELQEGLEKFVVPKLYKLLFRHSPADIREDERVTSRLQELAAKEPPQLPAALDAAGAALHRVDQYRAPRDKALCFANAYDIVCSEVSSEAEVVPTLAALMISVAPPNLFSNLEFTSAFRLPALAVQERRCLRDMAAALRAAAGRARDARPPAEAASASGAAGGVVATYSGGSFSATEGAAGGRDGAPAAPPSAAWEPLPSAAVGAGAAGTVAGAAPAKAGARGADDAASESPPYRTIDQDELPAWLEDAGVTFHFVGRSAESLLVGEVDELLEEYHDMARTLRELAAAGRGEVSPSGIGSPNTTPLRAG